jgi:hypothetical protein
MTLFELLVTVAVTAIGAYLCLPRKRCTVRSAHTVSPVKMAAIKASADAYMRGAPASGIIWRNPPAWSQAPTQEEMDALDDIPWDGSDG